ncbi:hypothetical protein F2P56_012977 [Juglans regia]|uniref:Reverse transcriptase/retrotransposon-derived protein RNase H-like domain-containing protein n=1 Tax=Juglans regia TaxID=51240 RepID=A0A834CV50_JUGRE|nr:hypothetical protein F2P56_012977 [Juglans regia]
MHIRSTVGKVPQFYGVRERNRSKPQETQSMKLPMNLNEVQKLAGKITALNRFVSRSTDKCIPFFQVLKKARESDARCEEAFSQLKEYLVKPPLLSHTKLGEPLSLCLVVTPDAVSAALVREKGKEQKPVYYVSRALKGVETRYPKVELVALAVVVATRRLQPYFQAHPIRIITSSPLQKVL